MVDLKKLRYSILLALGILMLSPLAGPAGAVFGIEAAHAQTINRINVTGNERVDAATVISYLTVRVGDTATQAKLSASTGALLETGLFSTARLAMSGYTLTVSVAENAVVSTVLFEGNSRFSDANLSDMVSLSSRGTYTDARMQSDTETIRLAYDRAGYKGVTVTARSETGDNGRLRVIFSINEGDRVGIAAISFTGNSTFDGGTLKSVLNSKETHFLSWLFKDDVYDEDKLAVDRELIRLWYVNHGYPDAQVQSAIGEYDASRKAYFLSFSISEGERYKFGEIGIETSIGGLNADALRGKVRTERGAVYSQDKLKNSTEDLAIAATEQGFSFADVRPRIDRDIANKTFNVTYLIDEGARVYVERINIIGNDKTRDFVIRRELDFAEGDPFNRNLVTRGKSNIEKLGYFESVEVKAGPGSASDKVVIDISVVEQSTGDYGFTAGFSSTDGLLGEVSLTESNFLGRGQYLKVALGATQSGRTFSLAFTEPRFAGLKIATGFDVAKSITDETDANFYGIDSTSGSIRFTAPLTSELSMTVFAGGEYKVFADADASSGLVTDGLTRTTATVGYRIAYSTLDSAKQPTTGLAVNLAQSYVGLDSNHISTDAKFRYYMPLFEDSRIIASIKGQAGILANLSGAGVHPTETYRLGAGLVRGFEYAGMGGRLASGEALGATWYAGLSGEVVFPLPGVPETYGLSSALWADAGYVGGPSAAGPAAVTGMAQQLRSSIGASLIWDSPFGPLRGDFAYVLQSDPGDRTQWFGLSLQSVF
ncbi:MAG: outer membrane protein assembly factor BamA [Alphaproteobacteria bacterium]|nr:outer membrane protein assembly factor BamA [Alphaproteobacteria bacterium]